MDKLYSGWNQIRYFDLSISLNQRNTSDYNRENNTEKFGTILSDKS